MKKKYTIIAIIIILSLSGLFIFSFFRKQKLAKVPTHPSIKKITQPRVKKKSSYHKKTLPIDNLSFNKNMLDLSEEKIPNTNGDLKTKLLVNNNTIDTYDFVNASDAQIKDIFTYTLNKKDYLLVLVYWDINMSALGVSGKLYEIYAYNDLYQKTDAFTKYLGDKSGFEGDSEGEVKTFPYKTKESIINRLDEVLKN